MNPLIGIAAGLVPDIIKLVAGDTTGQLADQFGKALADTVRPNPSRRCKGSLVSRRTARSARSPLRLSDSSMSET
jgi:hypothetical protein